MDELRFDGRVAIVTGAGGNPGLGRSYAKLLASRGAKVVVNDLGVGPDGRGAIGAGAHAVVKEILEEGGEAIVNDDTVATAAGAKSIVTAAMDMWGRLDVVINNAGVAPFALFDEISDEDIQKVVNVHLFGHIWMCRAAWPVMKSAGYGRFVNISSNVAISGLPYQSIYAAAKLGVVGLTRALAAEGKASGIAANALMPVADTLAWQTMLDPEFSERARLEGLTPETVAPAAAWLAHEVCSHSGKIFLAKGGSVNEVIFAMNRGVAAAQQSFTPEELARRSDAIVDPSLTSLLPDPTPQVPADMHPKAYQSHPRA